jgi:hypothetical protein
MFYFPVHANINIEIYRVRDENDESEQDRESEREVREMGGSKRKTREGVQT